MTAYNRNNTYAHVCTDNTSVHSLTVNALPPYCARVCHDTQDWTSSANKLAVVCAGGDNPTGGAPQPNCSINLTFRLRSGYYRGFFFPPGVLVPSEGRVADGPASLVSLGMTPNPLPAIHDNSLF